MGMGMGVRGSEEYVGTLACINKAGRALVTRGAKELGSCPSPDQERRWGLPGELGGVGVGGGDGDAGPLVGPLGC